MLQELVLSNFKTLQAEVRLPLGPRLTLLLGANNTGKSNALQALRLLGETARLQNLDRAVQALGGAASLVTRGQARCHLRARGVVDGREFRQHLTFSNPEVLPGGESFEGVQLADLDLTPAPPTNQLRLSDGSTPVVIAGRVLAAEAGLPAPAAMGNREKGSDTTPARLRWTGHALIDVGAAGVCAFAQRAAPDEVTLGDYGKKVGPDGKPIFVADWQSFRVRRGKGESDPLVFVAEGTYTEGGVYRVGARVTDVFGNDGIATATVEVK